MIKVSVMYPNTPDARFDLAYYLEKHMPMVQQRLTDYCTHYSVDKGRSGAAPGSAATYTVVCHLFFESLEAFQAGFGVHGNEIMGDIPNYTDLAPVIQVNEVLVG